MSYQPVPLPIHFTHECLCEHESLANIYTPASPPVTPAHMSFSLLSSGYILQLSPLGQDLSVSLTD